PTVATGTWVPAGEFGNIPRGAGSTVLPDGRVLVAGGTTSAGDLIADVTVFDPSTHGWQRAGHLFEGRSGPSVVALEDGSGGVVIAGGVTKDGASAVIEVYNVWTGTSAPAARLAQARTDAAAALLTDGRVLIAGGSNASGQALASVEFYD